MKACRPKVQVVFEELQNLIGVVPLLFVHLVKTLCGLLASLPRKLCRLLCASQHCGVEDRKVEGEAQPDGMRWPKLFRRLCQRLAIRILRLA